MKSCFLYAEVFSQTRQRTGVPDAYTWNLKDVCPSDSAWEKAKKALVSRFDDVVAYKGRFTASASELLSCLEFNSELAKEYLRLYSYTMMKSDEDTRQSTYVGMRQEMSQIGADYRAKASFIEPELVKMDKETIDRFLAQEPRLNVYRMYLYDIQRRKAHKLSEKEEKIMAHAGMVTDDPHNIFSIFSNAELPYPEATLSDGKKVKLDQAGYALYRTLPRREDRKIVFQTFWNVITRFRGTFGAQLYGNVKRDVFYARSRHYDSSLKASLDVNNIPDAVYHTLIQNVNANLDTFHRYLRLRKRMLNVDRLEYVDLYAPVVKGIDLRYDYDQARDIVLDALHPLGDTYMTAVERAFDERWIDVYPTEGKRSGAYSNDGGYDVHPYMLLNYNGKYQDVSTLAHEMGHSMHTYLSNKTQPFPMADYSVFLAEVASTFNEALLTHRMLKTIDDDNIRLTILMEYLDGIKGTVFRQAQFAEFELTIHERVENGATLTGDGLTELYGDVLKKYYGHEKGVCHIDDLFTVEWAYVPHFYYNFYVYQYATSFSASTALAQSVLDQEEGALEKYTSFLSAGGSDYPIALLKEAGVDMTTTGPFERTMTVMNQTMDEIERILDAKGS